MELFGDWGYPGLFLGAFLAATVLPFSSEALFAASLGLGGGIWATLIWATAGNWLGGLTSYWIGYAGKWEIMEKWLKVKPETLEKQKARVEKYGRWLALLTWVPFIGDVFAVALGFYRVDFRSSAVFMLAGKFLRYTTIVLIFIYFSR